MRTNREIFTAIVNDTVSTTKSLKVQDMGMTDSSTSDDATWHTAAVAFRIIIIIQSV